jgi:VCBS repeat-containing protein
MWGGSYWNDLGGTAQFGFVVEFESGAGGTHEDAAKNFAVLGNDSDIDASDVLTISSFDAVSAQGAAVSLNGDGTFHYDPTAAAALQALGVGESVVDTFSYTISDGNGGFDTATVSISVAGRNDGPVAGDNSAVRNEDTQVSLSLASLLGNDTDVDGDALSVAGVSNAVGGTVSIVGGNVVFTPNANFNGAAAFDYTVSDGHGGTDIGTVNVTVNAVNDAPVAGDDAFTFSGTGGPINISASSLLGNDSDVDGDALTITGVGNASGGTVALVGGNAVFTPDVPTVATGTAVATFGDGRLVNGLGGTDGFGENVVYRNDDGSTGFIDLSSVFDGGLDFFGTNYSGLYVNNNGNVTFGGSLGSYTPSGLTSFSSYPIIAPFWADVDTNGGDPGTPTAGGNSSGSNLVYYDLDATNGIFTVTWDDVGYYSSHTNPLNAFQLQLYDRGNGDFDIVFRYESINWTTGDASGGSGGLGGTVARAGWNSGNGSDFFELPTSGSQTDMLNLDSSAGNFDTAVWMFEVRDGTIGGGNNGFEYTVSDGNGGFDTAWVDLNLLF